MEIYKTNPNLSDDLVYRSVVRFMPNVKNTKQFIVPKKMYSFRGTNGKVFSLNSSEDEDSIIRDFRYKFLYKGKNPRNFSSIIGPTFKYYAFVKVIKDRQRPELEGTIQVFEFGYSIKKMIEENLEDIFKKDLSLKVSLTSCFWNYDESEFVDSKELIDIRESLSLYESLPCLEDFGYKPWTEEERNKVDRLLSELV